MTYVFSGTLNPSHCHCLVVIYFGDGPKMDARIQITVTVTLESQHKGSSAPSARSPVVDEERMRPGHWLESVLCITFITLSLMVGWQEGHPALENNLCHLSANILY